ncbi:hypothetical protein, partial [Dermabacter vaginalis]|uniref:hypothetical protein n=1 Tax=Dermabacter vaginalis TaxID=1630135 RepID=UPI001EF662FC
MNGLTKKPGRPGPSHPTELAGGEGGEKRREGSVFTREVAIFHHFQIGEGARGRVGGKEGRRKGEG